MKSRTHFYSRQLPLCTLLASLGLAASFLPASFAWSQMSPATISATDKLGALTLVEAERMMIARNRDIQLARRVIEAAEANTIAAGAPPNPNLTVGVGSINPSVGVGGGTYRDKTVDTSIRVDQLVERGEKRELRIATSQSLKLAADHDYQDAVRQQTLAVRGAFYDLMLAQDRLIIAEDTTRLFDRSVAAAELRFKAGDIAASDVARLRVDALRSTNDLRSVTADVQRARLALGLLIGAEDRASTIKAVDAWPLASSLPAEAAGDVVDQRADVRAAMARADAARVARDLARSQRTRDVSFGVQYDHYPSSPANTAGNGNFYGISVSIPLFARYNFEGEIRRAESDYAAAMEGLDRARAQARADLSRAYSDVLASAERLKRYDEGLLVEARRSAESAEFAFRNGATGVMDLLDARRTLRAIQNDAAQARSEFAKALSAWETGRMVASAAVQTNRAD
jgi:cobalt-zinc-cadmium efflux system outer membrane protein